MEKKRKRLAALFTLLFSAGVAVILLFFFGFRTPLPLPEEKGVEIELGGGGGGGGSDYNNAVADYYSSNANSGNLNDDYITDPNSEAHYSAGQTSSGNNNSKPQPDNRITNFKWGKGGGQGTGSGSGSGSGTGSGTGSGQGSGNGSGVGSGDGPNSGPGYSLVGRSAKSLPVPRYDTEDQGRVIVKVWVDKKGKVMRAEPGEIGTTITNKSLWESCKNAAMNSNFSVNEDAPEIQVGTITYFFVKQN